MSVCLRGQNKGRICFKPSLIVAWHMTIWYNRCLFRCERPRSWSGLTSSNRLFLPSVAGSVTTASAVRYTLLALISTPSAYTALQKEIDQNIESGRISSPVITNAEADVLPYLQAVIREGLRMWPPTTGFGSKQVPKGGDVICGYHVPEGTQIAQNFCGMMKLKNIWGEDADAFRPERWLEAKSQGHEKLLNSVVELDFGSGKYQCLGKRIALMELNKIFVEVCTIPLTSESWFFAFRC